MPRIRYVVFQNLDENVWFLSLVSAISNHFNSLSKGLLELSASLYGFSDGSLLLDQTNESRAGMGGFLKDNNNQVVFLFSGPLRVNSVFLTELCVVSHLIHIVKNSAFSSKECIFYTDSEEAVRFIMKIKMGVEVERSLVDVQTKELVRLPNFHFKFINRCLNLGADDLAKRGSDRVFIIQGWF